MTCRPPARTPFPGDGKVCCVWGSFAYRTRQQVISREAGPTAGLSPAARPLSVLSSSNRTIAAWVRDAAAHEKCHCHVSGCGT